MSVVLVFWLERLDEIHDSADRIVLVRDRRNSMKINMVLTTKPHLASRCQAIAALALNVPQRVLWADNSGPTLFLMSATKPYSSKRTPFATTTIALEVLFESTRPPYLLSLFRYVMKRM
jgi:hypothetical protein